MHAIETIYKGYRFRSRLEARYAIFFDALNVKWDYEIEGYDLDDYGWYLPDFWFPTFECFGEVKPKLFSKIEFLKVLALLSPCILFDTSPPKVKYYAAVFPSDSQSMTYTQYIHRDPDLFQYVDIRQSERKGHAWVEYPEDDWMMGTRHIYERAALQAKQARFEHGQVGAPTEWADIKVTVP